MKCVATCRHNISKLNSATFCQIIAAPPSGFPEGLKGEDQALGDNLHVPYFCKKDSFWYATFIGFSGCCVVVGRLYACFRKVAPLALPVEVFALVHCHHTPTLPLHPPPPRRARSLASSRQAKACGGLAWHGMVWLGARARCFHNEVRATCRHNISKLNSGLSVKLLQLPLQGSGKALGII